MTDTNLLAECRFGGIGLSKNRKAAIADHERHLGLFAATGVGVGAIVGGGILALAGVAFATAGPAAIVAFALNGMIAMLTAFSFAEMASKFPESGGTYTFSRKVLSVEAAFTVGWVVWFASIVAAVLYAVGFGHFAVMLGGDLYSAMGFAHPQWASDPRWATGVALVATLLLALNLSLRTSGGGSWANIIKVLVFGTLILGGLWAIGRQPLRTTGEALQPFFATGATGLFQAMGYSFIALQGFDLIAAVGGEVKKPERTIPKAMIFSLAIALLIYLPLLLVISAVGTEQGQTIREAAEANPEGIVAVAARNFLGETGYWLVLIAAVLSMFTALQANLFAASRIALSMSRDRTLPVRLSQLASNRRTPVAAIVTTAVLVALLILALPDVAAAGAASSLIFLMTFAIAHWLCILVRLRSSSKHPPPFRTPLFPAIPVAGGVACLTLAIFQGIAVPSAGLIAVVWLGIGGILFLSLFARRARLMDVSSIAANPELARLRGNTPLVLVPVANPQNAHALISLADTLVPLGVGRVLLHTVVVADQDWQPDSDPSPAERSHAVMKELWRVSASMNVRPETLATISPDPMQEIARVARLHRCESVLVGLSKLDEDEQSTGIDFLLSRLDTDVVVLRAPPSWQLSDTKRIWVAVGGRGGHDYLLARLLGSLSRTQKRHVTFVRVVPNNTSAGDQRRIKRDLDRMARDNAGSQCERKVIRSDDPVDAIATCAEEDDLVILGVQRLGPQEKLFGNFTLRVAHKTSGPLMVISHRG